MKIITSAMASKIVYDCGGDLYHLEFSRIEHGDDKVIDKLREKFKERDGLSPGDAAIRAGQFINDIDTLRVGGFGFKEMREQLDEEGPDEFIAYSTHMA